MILDSSLILRMIIFSIKYASFSVSALKSVKSKKWTKKEFY